MHQLWLTGGIAYGEGGRSRKKGSALRRHDALPDVCPGLMRLRVSSDIEGLIRELQQGVSGFGIVAAKEKHYGIDYIEWTLRRFKIRQLERYDPEEAAKWDSLEQDRYAKMKHKAARYAKPAGGWARR